MKLSELVDPRLINLSLESTTKDAVLEELVKLLRLSAPAGNALIQTLRAREDLGSTGVGHGIAIPHCRSLVVSKLHVLVGRSKRGIPFKSMDRKRAFLFFLIVAPPVGDPGEYLIALGAVAQAAKSLARDRRVKKVKDAMEFIELIEEIEE